MDSTTSSRQQRVSDRGSLMRRFSILSVTVKRIASLPKNTKPAREPARGITASSPKRSGGISSKDWDYIMAITDPESSGGISPTREEESEDVLSGPDTDADTIESSSLEDLHSTEDASSEVSDESYCESFHGTVTQTLSERWKEMRNPPAGHVHNVYCPFWHPEDVASRPECPDITFTLFSGNPFTKAGAAYLERWEECRRGRDGGNGCI